jgi:hydroxyacylglutathione hydrolase
MILKRLNTGMLGSNCYLIGSEGEGAIIDPGASSKDILEMVSQSGLKVKYIILTHAHLDHILSLDKIREELGVEVAAHEEDANSLSDSWTNGASLFGSHSTFKDADILLKDGQILKLGNLNLEIIHTPGHTPGGICIKVGDIIFTGDTLFRMSIGRSDLGRGDHEALMNSIKNKLMTLDDDVVIYPGHGTTSTIGYERANNPFIIL